MRHPGDFWVASLLARTSGQLSPPRFDDAIRFYTAAAALSPQSAVPVGQTHEPLEQSWPRMHAWPQEPQLFTSETKLVQTEGEKPLWKQQSEAPAAHTASP